MTVSIDQAIDQYCHSDAGNLVGVSSPGDGLDSRHQFVWLSRAYDWPITLYLLSGTQASWTWLKINSETSLTDSAAFGF